MDKRLLRLVCDQVEAVVKNQPPSNPQSLLNLLHIAEPNLTLSELYDKATRKAAFKSLQTLIHPDKHAAAFHRDSEHSNRVTRLFQDTTDFYLLCCDALQNDSNANSNNNNNNRSRIQNGHTNPTPKALTATTPTDVVARYVERNSEPREPRPYSMVQETITTPVQVVDTDAVARYVEKQPEPREPRPYNNCGQSQEALRDIYESANRPQATSVASREARPTGGHSQEALREIYNSSRKKTSKSLSPVRAGEGVVIKTTGQKQISHVRPSSSLSPVRRHHHQQQQHQRPKQQKEEDTGKAILEQYALTKKLPLSMDALHVWPFLRHVGSSNSLTSRKSRIPNNTLSWILACRCLNSRGAVLHGQRLQHDYFRVATSSKLLQNYSSVPQVMEYFGVVGNSHLFRHKRDIQHEIMTNGPVLSIGFQPDQLFFQRHEHKNNFQQVRAGECHPVLIVGWTVTSTGELWKVQSLYDPSTTVHVGFGQWNIEGKVVAPPPATLDRIPWQTPGPYLDLRMPRIFPGTGDDWRRSHSLGVSLQHHELETLNHLLGGFKTAIAQQRPFVIRDGYQLAYSRRYVLKEVLHSDGINKWKIAVERFDLKHEREEKHVATKTPSSAIIPATSASLVEV